VTHRGLELVAAQAMRSSDVRWTARLKAMKYNLLQRCFRHDPLWRGVTPLCFAVRECVSTIETALDAQGPREAIEFPYATGYSQAFGHAGYGAI
jgi:hypothetical protein